MRFCTQRRNRKVPSTTWPAPLCFPKWRFAVSPVLAPPTLATHHIAMFGLLAVFTCLRSSNFSRSSRSSTRTQGFGTCRRPQDRRGEGAAQEDQQEDQGAYDAKLRVGRDAGAVPRATSTGDLQHRIKHEPARKSIRRAITRF